MKEIIRQIEALRITSDCGMWLEAIGYNRAIDDIKKILEGK